MLHRSLDDLVRRDRSRGLRFGVDAHEVLEVLVLRIEGALRNAGGFALESGGVEVLWGCQDVVFESWVGRRETYLVLHMLMLGRTNVHLVGVGRFACGLVDVHVDILGLLGIESIAAAVSESA